MGVETRISENLGERDRKVYVTFDDGTEKAINVANTFGLHSMTHNDATNTVYFISRAGAQLAINLERVLMINVSDADQRGK